MENAQINLAVFRSIYHSAAILALCTNFGDIWASSIGSKKVILRMGTGPLADSVGRPLYASDEELIEAGGNIIEAASLWEAALEAGLSEEKLTEALRELEAYEGDTPKNESNTTNDEIWRKLGDLTEMQANEEADDLG